MHDLLHACWSRALLPIYQHYCRGLPTSCIPPARSMSLGPDEWLQLMTDCRVPTRGLELRRLQRLHAACVPAGAFEPRLLPQHFVRALVELALQRGNVEWLEGAAASAPGATPPRPLPDCLAWLLDEHVRPAIPTYSSPFTTHSSLLTPHASLLTPRLSGAVPRRAQRRPRPRRGRATGARGDCGAGRAARVVA